MPKKYRSISLGNLRLLGIVIFLAATLLAGNTHADEARAIMNQVDELQRLSSNGTLTLSRLSTCRFTRPDGQFICAETPRVKIIESYSKQFGEDLKDSKSISIIQEPASERGVGMITYTYHDPSEDTESWVYLPALGRVRRMASGRGEDREPVSVFGSEFTTEDMETGKTAEYTYTIVQEGDFGGRDVWVIEAKPKPIRELRTEYSRLIFWIDKERHITLRMQTYDRRGRPFKQILFQDIAKINNHWLARDVTLVNLQSQRLSNMRTQNIAMNVDVSDDFLTQRALTDYAFRDRTLESLRSHFQ